MAGLPPPAAEVASPGARYTCPYCRLEGPSDEGSCIHCGAPVDIRGRISESGWESQPPIKDMARIQFGQSTCQIAGKYAPAAQLRLAASEGVYFSHHTMLWADQQVQLGNQPLKGAWSRKMAGLDLIMMEATGPGQLALSENHAGETIAVPLMPGYAVDVREHRFLFATLNVQYDWYQSGIWYRTRDGDETETHYPSGMYLDRFSAAATPGLLMLHAGGNVFLRDLAPGETILVHPGAFVWKDASVELMLHLEKPAGGSFFTMWQPATPWLRFTGPGRVAVCSRYDRMEGTGRIVATSPATQTDWNTQRMVASATQTVGATQAAWANRFDDGPFESACDAFAAANGLIPGVDRNRGISTAHEYDHPSGLKVTCTVVDTTVAQAALGGITNALGLQGGALGKGLSSMLSKAVSGPSSDGGAPVEGLGHPATWHQPASHQGVLKVTKGARTLSVTVTGTPSVQDQYGWACAFANAALPTI